MTTTLDTSCMFGKYNGFVSKAKVSACMYFLVPAWLKWLDNVANYIRIFSFSKAFDNVPHDILCTKLKCLAINPYIANCMDY